MTRAGVRAAGPLAAAAAVGAVAGAAVVPGGRVAAGAALCAAGAGGLLVAGPERMATVAWGATAFAAPLSGVRVRGAALSDVFLVAAVALTLPSYATGRRRAPLPVRSEVFLGLAAIVCGGVLGTFFATRPAAGLAEMARFVVAAAGSVAAVAVWAPRPARTRWFCGLWLAGAVFNACWAIAVGPVGALRPEGLSTHPNHLGLVCMLGAAVALGLLLAERRALRTAAAAALAPLLLALLQSGSRAAVVGLAVTVPVFAVLTRRARVALRLLAVGAVLGAAVLAGWVHLPEQSGVARLVGGGASAVESDAERAEHLSRSLDRLERHPLTGVGFESAKEAHNIYVQIAVAAGPLGVLGFALVARSVLRNRSEVRAAGPAAGDRALLAGLVAGYTGYLVAGAFQNLLWDRYLWLYAAAALVLGASLAAGLRPAGGTFGRGAAVPVGPA